VTYRWREHEDAHAELREAVFFLEDVREGWGDRFADAVEAANAGKSRATRLNTHEHARISGVQIPPSPP
jgi:hypothetical protein